MGAFDKVGNNFSQSGFTVPTSGFTVPTSGFTVPTASYSSGMLSGMFTPLLGFITKWVFILVFIGIIIYVIKEHFCDIIPEDLRVMCEAAGQIGDAVEDLFNALGEGADEAFTAAQQLAVTVGSVVEENVPIVGEVADAAQLLTVAFDESLDESLTTDRYNWELKSIAESTDFPCSTDIGSPCEQDELSDCINVNLFGQYTRNQFYNKKCYLKYNAENPNSLNVGTAGNRYEAGREPVEFSGVRFVNDENPDRNGRFIPKQGYMSRFRNKELAIQSGELVDVCSLQSMEDCNNYHEDPSNTPDDDHNTLCEYDDTNNICKFKENPDCADKNTLEECDQLNSDDDYKCRFNNETNVCETVPLYSLSSEYDFNIPGRSSSENSYYLGCFADIQGDNENSGLMENVNANLCNLDTIKHIVYSSTQDLTDTSGATNPYLITKPVDFGLTQGTDPYEGGAPGCADTDQYSLLLGIHPTQFRVPYCFEFNDPRGGEDEISDLSSLNSLSNYGGPELVGNCASKEDEDECNSSERCEYDSDNGECIFKPQRICNQNIDCTLLGRDACEFDGLRNVCEWTGDADEGTCGFKDCVPLDDSHCSSMNLVEDKYVSTNCPAPGDAYCVIDTNHEQGFPFECRDTGNSCPGSYYRGDGTSRTGGPEATVDDLEARYNEEDTKCYMNCNSAHIGEDVDMYRCPGCTGTNEGESDTADDNGSPPTGGNDPNQCKRNYACVQDPNYPLENVCLKRDSLQSLSGSLVQAELCFSPPIIAGDSDVNRYGYWNFGQFVATSTSADGPVAPTCNPGTGTTDNLYNQDRGFSPIIQTLFGDLDKVPFIDDGDPDSGRSLCINKNPEEKSMFNCKYQNLLFDNCNESFCKKVHRFDSNTMIRGGNESSVCGGDHNNAYTCFNNHYIEHLLCYEGTNIGDETDNERLHRCREMRYNTLRDNMLHLRKFLNININEEDEHIILSHITDGQTSNGIPTIGSIHPCANENAYLEFYRNLHHLKNSINPEDRNKYRQAICLLNTGQRLTEAEHPICGGLATINDDNGEETEWTSIMPKDSLENYDELIRGWVHAGEPLNQEQADNRYEYPDIEGDPSLEGDGRQTILNGILGENDGNIARFDTNFYGEKLSSEGECISVYEGQDDICSSINSEEPPSQGIIDRGAAAFMSLLSAPEPEPDETLDPNEYRAGLCQGQSGCEWNGTTCSVSPQVQTIIDDPIGDGSGPCRNLNQSQCFAEPNCQYNFHLPDDEIAELDGIHDHYRKEYGNMLEQLCHYRVEYDSQSGSENLDLSSIRYGPINTGGAGEHLCSPCRYEGDTQVNRCSRFRNETLQTPECITESTSPAQLANANVADNICNDDGSCRCASLNSEENEYKWYLENHGSNEIDRKCRTSSGPTCDNDKNLLYTNDNYNEAVFGVADENADPLCDCRGDNPELTLHFGPKCDKSDGIDDGDINSCHGRYSDYEFSFDGTDYRKIEYINNKIDLKNGDNEIFYILLKYLRIRIKHALENGGHASPLYQQFFGQPIGGVSGNIYPGSSFWKNIEERSKKRIHRQLNEPNHFSPIDSDDPEGDWEGDYDSSKDELLSKFPFDLKDILLEIHENGYRYSPTEDTPVGNKDNYIFPNHLGSSRTVRKTLAETGNKHYSPWNIGTTTQDSEDGDRKIYSPDSLFYDFYRNSGLGPTLCDCTRDNDGDYFNDDLYGTSGRIEQLGSKNRVFENSLNTQTPHPMTGDVSKGHALSDNYSPAHLRTYWSQESSGKWGYRCELETDCSGESSSNGGRPLYSSLGWSLPSELGGRSTKNTGQNINSRQMNNFNKRDNWRYKNSLGNPLWATDPNHTNDPTYNAFYLKGWPNRDGRRLSHGGPGDVEGCKFLNPETQQIENCVLDDSEEPYGTTWDQIKFQRSSLEDENKSADYLKYDVSIDSGKLPDYFDLKGHKPLLCDCSFSLTEDNYNQPGDSNTPTFGDYCELATNQRQTGIGGTPRNATQFTNAWNSWTGIGTAPTDGVCNPDGLIPWSTASSRIADIYHNAAQTEASGGAFRFMDAPDNDCQKISQLQIDSSLEPYYFPEGRNNVQYFRNQVSLGTINDGIDLNGISYKWSCENQPGRNGDDCDPNEGPCMCNSGSCKNQTSVNDVVFGPIQYELLNDNAYTTRDSIGSSNAGRQIFNMEIQGAQNRGIEFQDIHPLTKEDTSTGYELIDNRTKLNQEFFDRGIQRVRGSVKQTLCNCDVDMVQSPNGQGCNLQDDDLCSGNGSIYTNSAGQAACNCSAGFTGITCDSCASTHYGYPNCTAKLSAGEVCGEGGAYKCTSNSCTRYGYGFDYTCN